jgi:hypothetical protein
MLRRSTQVTSKYVIAGAIVFADYKSNQDCEKDSQTPCYRVDLELYVYLKGDEKILKLLTLVSAVFGDSPSLVGKLKLEDPFRVITIVGISSNNPTDTPSTKPSLEPNPQPTFSPTEIPLIDATVAPTATAPISPRPIEMPTIKPSSVQSRNPTDTPTKAPSIEPSPTKEPTTSPTKRPRTASPTERSRTASPTNTSPPTGLGPSTEPAPNVQEPSQEPSTSPTKRLNTSPPTGLGAPSINYPPAEPFSRIILNPERGFIFGSDYYASKPVILNSVALSQIKNSTGTTVFRRVFFLDESIDADDLPNHVLLHMASDFEAIRIAGMKSVIRFAYVNPNNGAVVGDTEPSLDRLLGHIGQLAPILQSNRDVIMVVQAGFVGPWGEWHSSTHFDDDWDSLKNIFEAVLAAVPDRIVQVRTPKQKMTLFDSVLPLDEVTSHSGENIARTGHHNDCFLASDTDFGTYDDIDIEQPYLSQDTLYTAMGGKSNHPLLYKDVVHTNSLFQIIGETCHFNPPRTECTSALQELELFHYTYLSGAYHQDVLASWTGCIDEITSKLGYRLVLTSGTFVSVVPPGGALPFKIQFENEGYASPINPKRVQLVLRESSSKNVCATTLDADVRTWKPGSHAIRDTAILPNDIPEGSYEILLNIADMAENLKSNVDYKIKVANQGLNEMDTGLIKLLSTVDIHSSYSSPTAVGSQFSIVCDVSDDILPPVPLLDSSSIVVNGSFETNSAWSEFMDGYSVVTDNVHSGSRSIRVTNGGAQQWVSKEIQADSIVQIKGCSKSVGTSTDLSDYSIYADIYYTDSTYLWGQMANFVGGTTDWVCSMKSFQVPSGKTIERMTVFALYRNDPLSGTAYFDDIEVLIN